MYTNNSTVGRAELRRWRKMYSESRAEEGGCTKAHNLSQKQPMHSLLTEKVAGLPSSLHHTPATGFFQGGCTTSCSLHWLSLGNSAWDAPLMVSGATPSWIQARPDSHRGSEKWGGPWEMAKRARWLGLSGLWGKERDLWRCPHHLSFLSLWSLWVPSILPLTELAPLSLCPTTSISFGF